jgi:DNA-binding MarR family transcriptional regulator
LTFKTLKAARDFTRRHLDFVATLEDFDLLCEIGFHQESGSPLTMRDLLRLEITSAATLQRRLRRLRARGAIIQTRSRDDARVIEFALSPKLLKVFARYFELLGTAGNVVTTRCAGPDVVES